MATKGPRLSKEDWVRQQLARGPYANKANIKAYLQSTTGKYGTPSKRFVAHAPSQRPVVQAHGKKPSVGHNGGMKEFDLDSSVLSGGRYDKSTGDMELDFINPSIGTWEYAGVDAQTVRELKNDDSPGGYFNDVIRGVFEA